MKEGNPFGPFWDHFGVNFDNHVEHHGLVYNTDSEYIQDEWNRRYSIIIWSIVVNLLLLIFLSDIFCSQISKFKISCICHVGGTGWISSSRKKQEAPEIFTMVKWNRKESLWLYWKWITWRTICGNSFTNRLRLGKW